MLLRLRQLCNHPQLLARAKGEAIAANDLLLGGEEEENAAAEGLEKELLSELERAIKYAGQACVSLDPSLPRPISPRSRSSCSWVDKVKLKFQQRSDELAAAERIAAEDAELGNERDCPICFEPTTDSIVTYCCMQEFCASSILPQAGFSARC